MAQPGNSSSASSSARSVSTSRSLVGSSSSSTLPPDFSTLARCTRLRSPPDSSPISCCCWVPLKLKRPHVGPRRRLVLADPQQVLAAGDLRPDGLGVVQGLAGLVHGRQLHRVAEADLAAVGLLQAGQHAEEGGLAGAVRADDADDGARRYLEAQVLDQQPVAVALAQVVHLDHEVAQARPGRNVDLLGFLARPGTPGTPVPGSGEARLALGLPRLGVGAHPFELGLDGLLAGLLGLFLQGEALLPSGRARRSSCPPRECPGPGRAPGSSRPRCPGSSGRGSRR